MLKAYAQHYQTLSNERARALLEEYFAIEEEVLQFKRFYAKKLSEVLPMTRVARYFQIENKIEAITNHGLVRLIPLAKTQGDSSTTR
jgi:vacuolar-type H+-ATPase subunit D/Vma8